MDLTGEQWVVLEPPIGELPQWADKRSRNWRSSREGLNGIPWILHQSPAGGSARPIFAVPDLLAAPFVQVTCS